MVVSFQLLAVLDAPRLVQIGESIRKFDRLRDVEIGDVTGDGTTHLIGVETNSVDETLTVQAYDVSSGSLREVSGFTGSSTIGSRNLQGAALSDVNGDGTADLVFVVKGFNESKFSGVQVMTSTGAVFESALVWAETPTCQDDDCRIEFPGSSRY